MQKLNARAAASNLCAGSSSPLLHAAKLPWLCVVPVALAVLGSTRCCAAN
jgi:hypothetical protein